MPELDWWIWLLIGGSFGVVFSALVVATFAWWYKRKIKKAMGPLAGLMNPEMLRKMMKGP